MWEPNEQHYAVSFIVLSSVAGSVVGPDSFSSTLLGDGIFGSSSFWGLAAVQALHYSWYQSQDLLSYLTRGFIQCDVIFVVSQEVHFLRIALIPIGTLCLKFMECAAINAGRERGRV